MSLDTPSSDNLTNSIRLFGGNTPFGEKEDNSYSSNTIYIVAGERNIRAVNINGGLYANVGQTTRRITDRLRDDDYKRKAGGGRWVPLFEHPVGNSISDREIHIHLRQHPDVIWDRQSNNTEEFLFRNDLGDGIVAKEIILGILKKICLPMIQKENTSLLRENETITKELNKANEIIKEMLSDDYINNLVSKVSELESKLISNKVALSKLESKLISDKAVLSKLEFNNKVREVTIRNIEGRMVGQERSLTEKNAAMSELEERVNKAETNTFFLKAIAIFLLCVVGFLGGARLASEKETDIVSEQKEEIPAAASANVTVTGPYGITPEQEATLRSKLGLAPDADLTNIYDKMSEDGIRKYSGMTTPAITKPTVEK